MADTSGGGAFRLHLPDGSIERYDAAGKLLSIIDHLGRPQTLTYSDGTDGPNGGYVYSSGGGAPTSTVLPAGRLIRVEDNWGRRLQLDYDDKGRLVKLTTPGNLTYSFGHDSTSSNQDLLNVIPPTGGGITYYYNKKEYTNGLDLPGTLTGIYGSGYYMVYYYDAQGRAIEEISPSVGTNVNRYQLSFGNNSTTVTDPLGTARVYSFQEILGVKRSTGSSQPGGNGCGAASSAQTYDGNGNVASRTDFNGNVTTYTYDLTRNLETQRVEASGKPEARTTSTKWHNYWRQPIQLDEPKKRTTWTYHGDSVGGSIVSCAPASAVVPALAGGTRPIGVLCKKTEQTTTDTNGTQGASATITGLARTWTYTYNQNGQLLTADGPRTDVADKTTYTYFPLSDSDPNKRGRLATITNALGHITTITSYDAHGNPLTISDPNGVITTLTYDGQQRLLSRMIGSEKTSYSYVRVSGAWLPSRITFPDNGLLEYKWDLARRLISIQDYSSNKIDYTLDAMGNRIKEEIKDPSGTLTRRHQREIDALNRLSKDLSAQGKATSYGYDPNGNRTTVTDPLGHTTTTAYDALNRLIQMTDAAQGQTRLAYDGQDQLTQVTDPRNLATTYTIDGLGNRTSQTSPDTGTTVSTVDAAGNLLTEKDAKGQTTTSTYDALNRPLLTTYADGRQIRRTWDQGTHGKGRLTQIEEITSGAITGTLQYTYDALGRIASDTRTQGSLSHTVSYTYTDGKLSSLTLPSGRKVAYTRNSLGQITQVILTDIAPNAGQNKTVASAITYHPFGGVKSWSDGAGQTHTRSEDLDGRITGYSLGATPWLLGYDEAGRLTSQMDGANAAQSGTTTYDKLDRLTGAQHPTTSYGYSYDPTGNRQSQSTGSATRTYTTASTSNRLTNLTHPSQTLTYDANGSLTADGATTYTYNTGGRLVSAKTGTATTTYRINALGQRVRKTVTGTPPGDTLYHYDHQGHLIGESDATGKVTKEYLWLEDIPIAVMQ